MSSIESGISTRVREVIEGRTSEKGRVKELERLTGISENSWKNFLNGQQKATISMVEKISHAFPEMAFWIATGISDDQYGHVTPKWYSKYHYLNRKTTSSTSYFKEELRPLNEEIAHLPKGLEVLAEFDILKADKNDPTPKTRKSALLKAFRWMHVFLDEYVSHLGLETAISAFNDIRGEAERMKEHAENVNETRAYEDLLAHFAEKKDEIDQWTSRVNKEIDERMKQMKTTQENVNNKE